MSTIWNHIMITSGLYFGKIRHRRFSPVVHNFTYPLAMVALNLDQLENKHYQTKPWFAIDAFSVFRFKLKDYLPFKKTDVVSANSTLKQRVINKIKQLHKMDQVNPTPLSDDDLSQVLFIGRCRVLGCYFSPINFYYCYNLQDVCRYILCEVSNTPWNQRHYYLVDLDNLKNTQKEFHVSPFMEMQQSYAWKLKPPKQYMSAHIENHRDDSDLNTAEKIVFDATMTLKHFPLNKSSIKMSLLKHPILSFTVLLHIYYQALKLFIKKVPFVANTDSPKKT